LFENHDHIIYPDDYCIENGKEREEKPDTPPTHLQLCTVFALWQAASSNYMCGTLPSLAAKLWQAASSNYMQSYAIRHGLERKRELLC
jgi:hypothetical protein